MNMQTSPRGVFASRQSVQEIRRSNEVSEAVRQFLRALPKRLKSELVVMCVSTNEAYTSTSRTLACFTLLASLWEGGDRFKLFAKKAGGELEEVPLEPLLAVRQPNRNMKG